MELCAPALLLLIILAIYGIALMRIECQKLDQKIQESIKEMHEMASSLRNEWYTIHHQLRRLEAWTQTFDQSIGRYGQVASQPPPQNAVPPIHRAPSDPPHGSSG